jgi:hypothetical protein
VGNKNIPVFAGIQVLALAPIRGTTLSVTCSLRAEDESSATKKFNISINQLIKPLGQKVNASGREILSCRKRCGECVGVNLGGETSELVFLIFNMSCFFYKMFQVF